MTYQIGDRVEAIRVKRVGWEPGTVIERAVVTFADYSYRVTFDSGPRKWVDESCIRHPKAARTPPVRQLEPDTEEAESYDRARERSVGTVRAVPKEKLTRSKSHLDHVRSLPCCVTGATHGIEAHHIETGGMGRKCSDLLTVPLTAEVHRQWHNCGHFGDGDRTAALLTMWKACARVLASRLEAM